jgi:hypothetical protein
MSRRVDDVARWKNRVAASIRSVDRGDDRVDGGDAVVSSREDRFSRSKNDVSRDIDDVVPHSRRGGVASNAIFLSADSIYASAQVLSRTGDAIDRA